MPTLDCGVQTCYYNKEYKCCLEGIKVKGSEAYNSKSTACGSFREKSEGTFTNSCECTMKPSDRSKIACEAIKCCYNRDKKCGAEDVDITGNGARNYTETSCETFKCDCQ